MTASHMASDGPPTDGNGSELKLRNAGRAVVLAVYRALRCIKLYPVENQRVQQALDELGNSARTVCALDNALEMRVVGELLFINDTRLRLDLDNYASFGHVLAMLQQCGIGGLQVSPDVERREWQVFIAALLSFHGSEPDPRILGQIEDKLKLANVINIGVEPPTESEEDTPDAEQRKARAKQTYERSIAVTREVVASVRMGRSASVKKVKRAVQSIVDQVMNNEVALVGLTTLRDYDDYTFTHSINVTIFALSMGKRLGLSRAQLFDLGMAALVHDVGKGRIPTEVLNKQGKFTADEWHTMQSHTWLGSIELFKLREHGEIPYRSMVTAYEHHMRLEGKGYPRIIRQRELTVFGKIIAVADTFDAATSKRVYKSAKAPDKILTEMWGMPELGFEPVLVKALINLLGVYPVGTCVVLDTHELAIVHSANSDRSELHRPVIRLVCDINGTWLDPAPLVDLAVTDGNSQYQRSIIKVTDPERYGITPSDYFV